MRNDQVQTSTMHSVTETGGYNHHNNHKWTTLKPDHGRYFYFSSVYVARVLSGAANEKSSRQPGAALEGIHDFVKLQGCAETVRAAKAAMSMFPCDDYSPGSAE